ncbi:MAG: SPOR domain-containing protein [Roseovarius sp.]
MAGPEHFSEENTARHGPALGGLINLAGAVTSLALVVGVGVWGYKMMMRDVTGVPVVRAAEGPMRVQPDDPGGRQASHQGLAVNAVVAEGEAEGPEERVILAPAPLDLTLEDATPVDLAASLTPEAERGEAGEAQPSAARLAALDALASQLADGVTPLEGLSDVLEAETEQEAEPQEDSGETTAEETRLAEEEEDRPAIEGGLARSLRPQMRPTDLAVVAAVGAVEARTASLDGFREIDPETIPVGTRLAQLGAFASREIAEEEWKKLAETFGDYLDGKDRVIQKATRGGRTFYRLRAMGFEDLSEARRFCSALVAENAECIPVLIR